MVFHQVRGFLRLYILLSLILVILLVSPGTTDAYSGGEGICSCGDGTDVANGGIGGDATDACADCTAALGDNKNCVNQVNYVGTVAIANHAGTCIDNPTHFENKIFDCQGHVLDGNGVAEGQPDAGIYMNHKTNNTIRNCVITGFEYGIFIGQKDWRERGGNPIAVCRPWADITLDAPVFIRKDAKTIYLYMEGYTGGSRGEMFGLLKSTDDGESWVWEKGGDPISNFTDTNQPWSSRGDEACPAPVKVGKTIYMFYASRPASGAWGWNMGVATSTDWIHFTPDNNNSPLVSLGGAGAWDETSIFHTTKPILKGKKWFIFYTGRSSSGTYGVGYMTTSKANFPGGWIKRTIDDPLWKTKTQPRPKIIKIGNTYWMYYSDNGIKRRSSKDLIQWGPEKSVSSFLPLFDADVFETRSHGKILASVSLRWHSGKSEIGIWQEYRFNLTGNTISDCLYGVYLSDANNGIIENNNIFSNVNGLYLDTDSAGNIANNNAACVNANYDISNEDTNFGDNNTCSAIHNWDDTGATGCTYSCEDFYPAPWTCGCKFPPILETVNICGIEWVILIVTAFFSTFFWYKFASKRFPGNPDAAIAIERIGKTTSALLITTFITPVILALFWLCATTILVAPSLLMVALIAYLTVRSPHSAKKD